jgi:hypothetical protein
MAPEPETVRTPVDVSKDHFALAPQLPLYVAAFIVTATIAAAKRVKIFCIILVGCVILLPLQVYNPSPSLPTREREKSSVNNCFCFVTMQGNQPCMA